jgi:hypothetical protein
VVVDHKVLKDHKGHKVLKVVVQEHKVLQEIQELKVLKGSKVPQDLVGHKV